jgi:hypothetical protein
MIPVIKKSRQSWMAQDHEVNAAFANAFPTVVGLETMIYSRFKHG